MFSKSIITALSAFAVAVSGAAVQPAVTDGTLQTRAPVQFSIGYTLCSWHVTDPWGGQGGSYTQLLAASGDVEIGCVEMDDSPTVPSGDYDEGSFFRIWDVCGMDINFYNNGGNWDFYENGGDGTLLGTCYGHDGTDHYCFDPLAGGACTPHTILKCYASGNGWPPCSG